jgi:hypothetical protein
VFVSNGFNNSICLYGRAGIEVLNCNSHVRNGCQSIWQPCGRGDLGHQCMWKCRGANNTRQSYQTISGCTGINPESTEVRGTGTVELLGPRDNVVGTGVLQDNIKCGMELNAVKLCPFEVAVQVVRVLEESVWTGEIVGEQLG